MLGARVEQEARPRLDDATQLAGAQEVGHLAGPAGQLRGVGVEVVDVEGQRDAVVARVGHEGDRVLQAVFWIPFVL